jgi:ketosteroid isomerase-like protein
VRERKVFYEQGMRDAVTTYEQVFGRPPDASKVQDLESPMSSLPVSIDAALELGLVENPKLKQLRLQMDRSNHLISLERSNFSPKVDLVLSRTNDDKTGGMYKKAENSALIKFSWSLFSGGDSVYRTQAAVFEVKEIGEREASTKRKTAESIRMSWNQYQKGLERLQLLEQASETSRRVMEGRKKLRDAGRESVLAVLDAEVEYYGVLGNKVNAMIDARLGSYRLLHAIGLLEFSSLRLDGGAFSLPVRSIDKTLDGLVGQTQPQPDASLQTPPAGSVPAPVVVEATKAVVPQVPVLPEVSTALTLASQESVVSKDPAAAITDLLNQWAQAWSSRDIEAYGRFYGDAFKTGPHRSKAAWLKFRQSRIVGRSSIEVSIEDLQVKAIEPNQAEATFVQNYASGSIKDRSQKTMRLEKTAEGWRIVSEQSAPIKRKALPQPVDVPQPVPIVEAQKPATQEPSTSPIAALAPAQESKSESAEDDPTVAVTDLLNQWAQAWSSRDIEAYGRFYGDAFKTGPHRSKAAWLKFRQSRIVGRSSIEVSIEDLQVKAIELNQAEATFVQNYASGSIKDRSQKTMRLEKTAEGWRIVSEQSTPVPKTKPLVQTTVASQPPLSKEWSAGELSQVTTQVISMLDQWSQTFVNKDFDTYSRFYDERFKTAKFRNKSAWLKYKKPRLMVDQDIQVAVENVRVQPSQADRIEVTFVKRYTSQALKYRTVKTMILAQHQGSWSIVSEVE